MKFRILSRDACRACGCKPYREEAQFRWVVRIGADRDADAGLLRGGQQLGLKILPVRVGVDLERDIAPPPLRTTAASPCATRHACSICAPGDAR